jgi:hypothetical protein
MAPDGAGVRPGFARVGAAFGPARTDEKPVRGQGLD